MGELHDARGQQPDSGFVIMRAEDQGVIVARKPDVSNKY
jgi:hypothetical protein